MQELLNDFIVPHWGFLVVSACMAIMGQVSKGTIWTKENITKYKVSKPWLGEILWWGRKTMPLHPVLAGMILGLLPGMPLPETVQPGTQAVLYYIGAGVSSTWIFSVVKQMAKKKGIDLELPGQSVVPSPPPPPVGQA